MLLSNSYVLSNFWMVNLIEPELLVIILNQLSHGHPITLPYESLNIAQGGYPGANMVRRKAGTGSSLKMGVSEECECP